MSDSPVPSYEEMKDLLDDANIEIARMHYVNTVCATALGRFKYKSAVQHARAVQKAANDYAEHVVRWGYRK